MKSEEKIKEGMNNIKDQLPNARGEQIHMLQGQYSALEWVLDEKVEKEE